MVAAVVAVAVGSTGVLASSGFQRSLAAAVAPPGARPGVDVPGQVGPVADAPLGTPPPAPLGSGGFAFMQTTADGAPVTFDPCRELRLVVNPEGSRPALEPLLLDAVEQVSAASGLRLVVEGTTDERVAETREAYQPERYGDRWAPVLVAWADPATTPGLDAGRDGRAVLGRAGPQVFTAGSEGSQRYVTGTAVFNAPALQGLLDRGRSDWVRAVFLHELGHLVGLDHVGDPYQVMHEANVAPLATFRDGDLRGLEQLGTGRCHDDY